MTGNIMNISIPVVCHFPIGRAAVKLNLQPQSAIPTKPNKANTLHYHHLVTFQQRFCQVSAYWAFISGICSQPPEKPNRWGGIFTRNQNQSKASVHSISYMFASWDPHFSSEYMAVYQANSDEKATNFFQVDKQRTFILIYTRSSHLHLQQTIHFKGTNSVHSFPYFNGNTKKPKCNRTEEQRYTMMFSRFV